MGNEDDNIKNNGMFLTFGGLNIMNGEKNLKAHFLLRLILYLNLPNVLLALVKLKSAHNNLIRSGQPHS